MYLAACHEKYLESGMLLEPEEEDELKKTFIRHDKDDNGMLEEEEIGMFFASLQVTFAKPDVQAFFALADKDGDGTIDYDEFMHVIEDMMNQATGDPHAYMEMFQMIDQEGNGHITMSELVEVLQNTTVGIGLPDVKSILNDCIVSNEDKITFTDFRRLVLNE